MDVTAYTARKNRGVRWWRFGNGFGIWLRDTRIRMVHPYDPSPRLWLGPYRVAIIPPGTKVRGVKR